MMIKKVNKKSFQNNLNEISKKIELVSFYKPKSTEFIEIELIKIKVKFMEYIFSLRI